MSATTWRRAILALGASLLFWGCGPPPAPKLEMPSERTACRDNTDHPSPLIVEWPTGLRTDLEMMRAGGLVAVRWQECNLQILTRCELPGKYVYHPVTPKKDEVSITDEASLDLALPFYGASLGADLKRAGQLNVAMLIAGTYRMPRMGVDTRLLRGDCSQATHVITSMSVGAFRMYTGAQEENILRASVPVVGVGGDAIHKGTRAVLKQDGEAASCDGVPAEGAGPNANCAATLRIELRAIGKVSHTVPAGQAP